MSKKLFFLKNKAFILFFYFILINIAAFPQQQLKIQKTQNNLSKNNINTNNYYSLNDILNNLPNVYISPVYEALSTIVEKEDKNDIKFQPLLGGFSTAQLFQFEVKNKKYVLRLLDVKKSIKKRKSEITAHKIGSQLKIAPKLIYVDQLSLVMLMDFIEGRLFVKEDLNNINIIEKIMQAIKKFHNYYENINLLKCTKVKSLQNIYMQFKKKDVYPYYFDQLHKKLQKKATKLNTKHIPSHGDLNPSNILIATNGNIYLIDWTEATIDNPFLDIGWLSCFSEASKDQIKKLLKGYFKREPTKSEIKEVLFYKDITTIFMTTLWIGRQEKIDKNIFNTFLKKTTKIASKYNKENVVKNKNFKKTKN
ncbi:MAG: hypothetical protein AMS24_04935 [Chlamydiae bacterium SM23_39]|nr:MAG: hypothetical protein AMS24_04935 [Chlamydiae bacterium SM23_39]